MTAPADLVPGEFVKVAFIRQMPEMFGGDQQLWCFARYVSTVDHQIVVEHADGARQLVNADNVHPLEAAHSRDTGGASS